MNYFDPFCEVLRKYLFGDGNEGGLPGFRHTRESGYPG